MVLSGKLEKQIFIKDTGVYLYTFHTEGIAKVVKETLKYDHQAWNPESLAVQLVPKLTNLHGIGTQERDYSERITIDYANRKIIVELAGKIAFKGSFSEYGCNKEVSRNMMYEHY